MRRPELARKSAIAFIPVTYADLAGLQWTVNAYALTLAGLLLIGGSLGDHLGRRKVFAFGVAWFAVASLLCAVAPSIETLIAARAIQGVGAALLSPVSFALLEPSLFCRFFVNIF